MKLFIYNGETPTEALKIAQQKHGEDALVVKTKEVRKRTDTQGALYEVVIAVDDESVKEKEEATSKSSNKVAERLEEIAIKERERRRSVQQVPQARLDDVSLQLSDAVRQISKIANTTPLESKKSIISKPSREESRLLEESSMDSLRDTPKVQTRAEDAKELKLIKSEIDKLNDKLKLIQNMFWDEKGPKKDGLVIPHEFAEIYRIAKNSGMHRDHLDKIMQLTLELMPLKMRENSILIKRYFREVLRKMVYCRQENLESGGRKIIMLVGPTGVGKTTTLAKLAARYSRLLSKNYKVGIITLDTYRIGAVDQLMFYAKKMKLSIDTVSDPSELSGAIDSLKYCDYVLIDTVGSSQHDKQKIEMLRNYVNSDPQASIDVNLVISATTKYEDLRDIYHTFSSLNIDTLILTKLDETRGFGNIFSLIHETKKPVSYLSIGQEVPNDLSVATSEFLADCLLDGFKKVER
ncbi:MAG: flagellar biosynthesis protein FlhF [Wolinella sp.]